MYRILPEEIKYIRECAHSFLSCANDSAVRAEVAEIMVMASDQLLFLSTHGGKIGRGYIHDILNVSSAVKTVLEMVDARGSLVDEMIQRADQLAEVAANCKQRHYV